MGFYKPSNDEKYRAGKIRLDRFGCSLYNLIRMNIINIKKEVVVGSGGREGNMKRGEVRLEGGEVKFHGRMLDEEAKAQATETVKEAIQEEIEEQPWKEKEVLMEVKFDADRVNYSRMLAGWKDKFIDGGTFELKSPTGCVTLTRHQLPSYSWWVVKVRGKAVLDTNSGIEAGGRALYEERKVEGEQETSQAQ
jgi:hypothetical protein